MQKVKFITDTECCLKGHFTWKHNNQGENNHNYRKTGRFLLYEHLKKLFWQRYWQTIAKWHLQMTWNKISSYLSQVSGCLMIVRLIFTFLLAQFWFSQTELLRKTMWITNTVCPSVCFWAGSYSLHSVYCSIADLKQGIKEPWDWTKTTS